MIGARLSGRYEILREIGRGGMGVVYLAYDPMLEREVAVKIVPASQLTQETEERFKREARVIARMDHPSIVVVYDTGSHEGSLFFVMPFVPGHNLRMLMQEKSLSLGEVLDVGIQVAEALDYSHLRGIVHRDIKPENILVTRSEEEGFRARITDFGLAVPAAQSTEKRLTRSGSVVGTVAYLSPEQIQSRDIDGRSDLYSLATVLYECVVGDVPFPGEIHRVLFSIANDVPMPPRQRGAQIDEELEQFLMRCMEKDPALRPQRAREAAEFLTRYRNRLQQPYSFRLMPEPVDLRDISRSMVIPLIGREREFGELQRRLNDAVAGECQFVAITGEAGSGKTRLVEELETAAGAKKIRYLRGRFVDQDRAIPYQGYCELLQEYFRKKSSDTSDPTDFSDLGPALVSVFPVLSEIFEGRTPSASAVRPGPVPRLEDRTAIFELLVRSLMRAAGGKPLVMVLEDLHSADVSVEALQYVVRRLGPTPTLVVATWRSSEIRKPHPIHRLLDSFQGERRFAHIQLEPLSQGDHSQLLQALMGGARVSDSFAARIYESTEGNPYFTRELVRSLIESQRVVRSDSGSWTLSGDTQISADSLPATIQQTVEKRIEALAPELSETLSVASVLGRSFEARDLQMLVEDGASLEDRLEPLIQLGFLEEERESRGDRLLFSSGVIRDVLYAGLPRRRKRVLHRKFAEQLEARFAGRLERVYPQLLHHYREVDHPEKTIEYGLKLARKSLAAFSPTEVLRAARCVLDFVEDDLPGAQLAEAEARSLIASALRLTGQIDGALKELAAAIDGYRREKRGDLATEAILQAAETAWAGRRIEETRRWVDTGIETARETGNAPALRKLLTLGTTVANLRGDFETAREYRAEADALTPERDSGGAVRILPGGEVTVALPVQVRALHPSTILVDEESEVMACVFETLLTCDANGNLAPGLCDRWEVLEKGKSFLFTLRQGVRMHDGRVLTAQEVRESIETALKVSRERRPVPAYTVIAGAREFLSGASDRVSGILAFRENKLGIQLSEPLPVYPALLTDVRTGVALEAKGSGETGAPFVGTGPFRVVSADPDVVVLEKNADHRDAAPILDRIVFRAGLNAADISGGFHTGRYDIAGDLLPADLEEILRKPQFRGCIREAPKKNVYFALFNTNSPVARDPRIRAAICGAIRSQDLVWRTLGRFAHPAEGLIPPGILGHDPGRRRQTPARAEITALLQAAMPAPPLVLRAAIHPVLQDRYAALLDAMFRAWADLGIQIRVDHMSLPEYLKTGAQNEGLDLMIGRFVADYEDPDNFTFGLFHSREGEFRNYYSSLQLDHLVEEARSEIDPLVREKLYRRVDSLLVEGGILLPLFHEADYRLFHPGLAGARLRSSPPYVNYSEIGRAARSESPGARKAEGGVLRIPIPRPVETLDPALVFHSLQSEPIGTIFENLTRQEEGATTAPWLIAEMRPLEGGQRFYFRLRDHLRFQDGRRVTSRDVRYSFERALQRSESQSRAWYLSPVSGAGDVLSGKSQRLEGFTILSALEFEIRLDQPVSFFPALLSTTPVAVVPEGLEEFTGSWREGCVGTGPFRVVRFDPGRRLELEPNPYYWRTGYPRCDGLVFTFDVEPEELAPGFRKGEYAMVWNLPPHEIESLRQDPEFATNYREIPSLSTYYVVFNIHQEPMQDEDLRRALADMLDPQDLVKRFAARTAVPAGGLMPPGLLGYEPGVKARTGPRSVRKARQLDLSGMLHSAFDGPFQALGREILAVWRNKGIHVQVQETRADVPNALVSASPHLLLSRWIGDYPDADTFAHGLLHTQGQMGRFCGTPEMDWLIDKARAETDVRVRHSIYREIEEILARRALMVPLFHEQSYRIARPEVMDFELRFARPSVLYESLWLRK